MMTLAQQHTDALKEIVNSNTCDGSSGGMTDTSIGRPLVFKEDEQRYGEWKAKLLAVLLVSSPQAVEWISWAGSQPSTIDEETISFGNRLYAILLCTEEPFNICYSVADGNDLGAQHLTPSSKEPHQVFFRPYAQEIVDKGQDKRLLGNMGNTRMVGSCCSAFPKKSLSPAPNLAHHKSRASP